MVSTDEIYKSMTAKKSKVLIFELYEKTNKTLTESIFDLIELANCSALQNKSIKKIIKNFKLFQ